MPQEGKVSVAQFGQSEIGQGHISLVDAGSSYDVLVSIMPTELWPKFIEEEAVEVDYGLCWVPTMAHLEHDSPIIHFADGSEARDLPYDREHEREAHARRLYDVMTSVAYLSGNARLGEGVRFLNYLQASIREVLCGDSGVFPPTDVRMSPYQPHGIFEFVPPAGPFDLRVRAKANISKKLERKVSLEKLLLDVAMMRDGKPRYGPRFYNAVVLDVADCTREYIYNAGADY